MAISPRVIIDGYLEQGAYDYWQKVSAETLLERARFDGLRTGFQRLDRDLTIHIADDFMWLEKLSSDYNAGMRLVASGQAVSKSEIDCVCELYTRGRETS